MCSIFTTFLNDVTILQPYHSRISLASIRIPDRAPAAGDVSSRR